MISYARGIGWDVAAANLEYFLSGQGGDRQIDSNWLRAYSSIQEAELKNQQRFENQIQLAAKNLSDGESITMTIIGMREYMQALPS